MSSQTFHPDRRALLFGAAAWSAVAGVAPQALAKARPRSWTRAHALLEQYVAAKKISGACAAVRIGEGPVRYISSGAIAFDGAPAAPDSIWRIFSMSKPVTGLAALTLVEAGKLGIDQPVADFVPEFANMTVLENGVTRPARTRMLVRHLLTHTAGLGYQINEGTELAVLYRKAGIFPGDPTPRPEAPKSLDEFGARLATLPLGSDPGTRYEYSVGLDLMGLVIQRASGKPFETYLHERLLGPMKMDDTGFFADGDRARRLSTLYGVRDGKLQPLEPPGKSAYEAPPVYPSGGGGLLSSAADYTKFCQMLLHDGRLDGEAIVAPQTARLAHSNLLPPGVSGEDHSYFGAGMGVVSPKSFEKGTEPAGSYGWAGAAGTLMWVDPVHRLSAVMMTQYLPSHAYPLWKQFRRAVYADLAA